MLPAFSCFSTFRPLAPSPVTPLGKDPDGPGSPFPPWVPWAPWAPCIPCLPSGPVGRLNWRTTFEAVPPFFTVASDPAGSVVVVPMETGTETVTGAEEGELFEDEELGVEPAAEPVVAPATGAH